MTWVKNVTGTWTYYCTMAHWMWVRRTRCWIEDAECSALALGKSPQNRVNQLTKLMRKLGFLICYPIASGKPKCNAMQRITAVTSVQYAAQLSFICNAFYLLFCNEFFCCCAFSIRMAKSTTWECVVVAAWHTFIVCTSSQDAFQALHTHCGCIDWRKK